MTSLPYWTHGRPFLRVFVQNLNCHHPTIKFIALWSAEEVVFLNTRVYQRDWPDRYWLACQAHGHTSVPPNGYIATLCSLIAKQWSTHELLKKAPIGSQNISWWCAWCLYQHTFIQQNETGKCSAGGKTVWSPSNSWRKQPLKVTAKGLWLSVSLIPELKDQWLMWYTFPTEVELLYFSTHVV